jgi:hypothetical protein
MNDFYGVKLTDREIGYIAGIIDGEGCIHISRPISRVKDCKSPIYQTYISVTNTEMAMLEWLHLRIGGNIRSIPTDKKSNVVRKPIWRWYCPIVRLTDFCNLILKDSVIKKRELEIMIEIRKTYKSQSRKGIQGVQKVPDEDLEIRHRCYLELKSLHNRPNLRHPNIKH